jgi:hypothetical protein
MTIHSMVLFGLLSIGWFQPTDARSNEDLSTALLDVYHQGRVNNCGSVALTKMVIARYGTNPSRGPFARHTENDGSVSMELIDGTHVYVTADEVREASSNSGFIPKGGQEATTADVLYAAMAVRRSGGNDGRTVNMKDFHRAVSSLGHGGDPADEDVLPALLGFRFDDSSPSQFHPLVYAVGSGSHIAYAKGDKYDEHGSVHGGELIEEFYKYYGTTTMYRYALSMSSSTPDIVVRQCSDGKDGWVPANAVWRVCKAGEVTRFVGQ